MLIEAVDSPIRYQWPKGEIRLTPGQPVPVPSDRGLKILKECGPKVRVVDPFPMAHWLSYQVPGDHQEGPFEVVEIVESGGGWWALVSKPDGHAWIHERLVTKVESRLAH